MKTQRWLTVLTAVNLTLLALIAAHALLPARAAGDASVLRARALEIVDEQGRVRASLKVYPADPAFRWEDGRRGYPETVMLRLITSDGRPNVKLAAKEDGAGILLGGASNPTYAALGSDDGVPKLRMVDKDNKQLAITP